MEGKNSLMEESDHTSRTSSPKELSPVVEQFEHFEDDDIAQIESRSHSAEPPRCIRHLSGPNDTLSPLLPIPSRRQVINLGQAHILSYTYYYLIDWIKIT